MNIQSTQGIGFGKNRGAVKVVEKSLSAAKGVEVVSAANGRVEIKFRTADGIQHMTLKGKRARDAASAAGFVHGGVKNNLEAYA